MLTLINMLNQEKRDRIERSHIVGSEVEACGDEGKSYEADDTRRESAHHCGSSVGNSNQPLTPRFRPTAKLALQHGLHWQTLTPICPYCKTYTPFWVTISLTQWNSKKVSPILIYEQWKPMYIHLDWSNPRQWPQNYHVASSETLKHPNPRESAPGHLSHKSSRDRITD